MINKRFAWTYKTRYNEEFLEIGTKLTWLTIINKRVVKLEGEVVNLPDNHRKIGFVAVGSNPNIKGIKFRDTLFSNDDSIKYIM